jgi:hypothetical protein
MLRRLLKAPVALYEVAAARCWATASCCSPTATTPDVATANFGNSTVALVRNTTRRGARSAAMRFGGGAT